VAAIEAAIGPVAAASFTSAQKRNMQLVPFGGIDLKPVDINKELSAATAAGVINPLRLERRERAAAAAAAAAAIKHLSAPKGADVFKKLTEPQALEVLKQVKPTDAAKIFNEIPVVQAAILVENMNTTDAAAILKHVSAPKLEKIAQNLSPPKVAAIADQLPAARSKTLSAVTHMSVDEVEDIFGDAAERNREKAARNVKRTAKQLAYEAQREKRRFANVSNSPFANVSADEPEYKIDKNAFGALNLDEAANARNNDRRRRRQIIANKRNGKFSSKSYSISPDVHVNRVNKKGLIYNEWVDDELDILKNEEKQRRRDLKTSKYYHSAKKQCLAKFPNYKTDQKKQYQKCIPEHVRAKENAWW
jgi:hypothetical protein